MAIRADFQWKELGGQGLDDVACEAGAFACNLMVALPPNSQ